MSRVEKRRGTWPKSRLLAGVVVRCVVLVLFVLFTYSPNWPNFYKYYANAPDKSSEGLVFALIAVVVVHLVLLGVSIKAFGKIGLVLFAAFMGGAIYYFSQYIDLSQGANVQLTALVIYGTYLGCGSAGRIVWRKLFGIVSTDEEDS